MPQLHLELYTESHATLRLALHITNSCSCLESRFGVFQEHLKVSLIPLSSLRRGLVCVRLATERVVAGRAGVAGTVRLTTGLDPDEGIGESRPSVGRGTDTKAGVDDVAPVAPFKTTTGFAVAASVDDGVVGHACALKSGTEELDVLLLVLGLVPLGVGGTSELTRLGIPAEEVEVSDMVRSMRSL